MRSLLTRLRIRMARLSERLEHYLGIHIIVLHARKNLSGQTRIVAGCRFCESDMTDRRVLLLGRKR